MPAQIDGTGRLIQCSDPDICTSEIVCQPFHGYPPGHPCLGGWAPNKMPTGGWRKATP